MSSTKTIPAALVGACPTASLTAGPAAPAAAATRDDDRVIRTGSCSGGAEWKLKVTTDDGRLVVEGLLNKQIAVRLGITERT